MRAARCTHCGTLAFPPHAVCAACRHDTFEGVELREGRLLTYTVIHVPPPGLPSPLTVGIVEFEGGLRALGRLAEPVEVGQAVVGEWTVLREGEAGAMEGFRFRPAPSSRADPEP